MLYIKRTIGKEKVAIDEKRSKYLPITKIIQNATNQLNYIEVVVVKVYYCNN